MSSCSQWRCDDCLHHLMTNKTNTELHQRSDPSVGDGKIWRIWSDSVQSELTGIRRHQPWERGRTGVRLVLLCCRWPWCVWATGCAAAGRWTRGTQTPRHRQQRRFGSPASRPAGWACEENVLEQRASHNVRGNQENVHIKSSISSVKRTWSSHGCVSVTDWFSHRLHPAGRCVWDSRIRSPPHRCSFLCQTEPLTPWSESTCGLWSERLRTDKEIKRKQLVECLSGLVTGTKTHLEASDSLVLPELFPVLVPAQRGNRVSDRLASKLHSLTCRNGVELLLHLFWHHPLRRQRYRGKHHDYHHLCVCTDSCCHHQSRGAEWERSRALRLTLELLVAGRQFIGQFVLLWGRLIVFFIFRGFNCVGCKRGQMFKSWMKTGQQDEQIFRLLSKSLRCFYLQTMKPVCGLTFDLWPWLCEKGHCEWGSKPSYSTTSTQHRTAPDQSQNLTFINSHGFHQFSHWEKNLWQIDLNYIKKLILVFFTNSQQSKTQMSSVCFLQAVQKFSTSLQSKCW